MDQVEAVDLLRAVVGPERVAAEPDAAAALAQRCAYLPLALRIAAERLATYPHRTLSRAAAELADREQRLNALEDTDNPQLAVRAALSCSYRELDSEAKRTFRLLGLFPGATVNAPAAAALLDRSPGRTQHLLDVLVSVHLLEEVSTDRYRRHDLLRDYAAERAAAEETAAERLAAVRRLTSWYVHTIDAANRILAPQRPVDPLGAPPPGVASLAFDTVERARDWCDTEADTLVPLVRLAAAHRLDAAWQIPTRSWDWLLLRKPWSVWIDSHKIGLQTAIATGHQEGRAWVELNLGEGYRQTGEYELARRHAEQSLALRRASGDRHGQAWALACLGFIACDDADVERAADRFQHSLRLFEEIGDRHGQGIVLPCVAEAQALLGNDTQALGAFDSSLALARETGDDYGEGQLWFRRARIHLQRAELTQAVSCLDRSIRSRRAAGDDWGTADALEWRGDLLARLDADRHEEARQFWQEAYQLFARLGDPRAAGLRDRIGNGRQPGC